MIIMISLGSAKAGICKPTFHRNLAKVLNAYVSLTEELNIGIYVQLRQLFHRYLFMLLIISHQYITADFVEYENFQIYIYEPNINFIFAPAEFQIHSSSCFKSIN